MLIGGFQRNTLVDFPKIVASTIFLAGCNFRCPYCHNPELAEGICDPLSLDEILSYLSRAKKIIDGVCITGGEPTLYPEQLKSLIQDLRKLNLKVKIDTNGSNPELLKELDVDYIAMDVKTSFDRYSEFSKVPHLSEKVRESFEYLLDQKKYPFEFRTTLYPPLVGGEEVSSLALIIGDRAPWYLQKFLSSNCLELKAKNVTPYTENQNAELLAFAQRSCCQVFLRG